MLEVRQFLFRLDWLCGGAATDRVHRIGQQRGVQAFKFVTRGTLEGKMAALIEKGAGCRTVWSKRTIPGCSSASPAMS